MRRYEVAVLSPSGDADTFTRVAPAAPAFEAAFTAFGRGTVFATDRGPVAVEDLWPGDRLRTGRDSFETLLWKGSTMIVADMPDQSPNMDSVIRVAADALGLAKPQNDLVLGPYARVLHHAPAVERITGDPAAFVPIRDFLDGDAITEIRPPTPVRVFHLALERHTRLLANGVEVESFHPGDAFSLGLRGPSLELFLSLFPHLESLEEFGPMGAPRLRLSDLSTGRAALA